MINKYKEIDTPALIIDKRVMEENIRRMQALADSAGVSLRPHVKTHKSVQIARMQIKAGAKGICAAKLSEAEVMAGAGINNILIANIITGELKTRRLAGLSESLDYLAVCVDSRQNVRELDAAFKVVNRRLKVYVEIDSGLGRCGLKKYDEILQLCRLIGRQNSLELDGILTHAGHAYGAANSSEVESIGLSEGHVMSDLAKTLRSDGITINQVSVGSAPTARFSSAVEGVTELRSGVYVFNDMMQVSLGAARIEDCALTVLATVISTPEAGRAITDAGSKSLNLDKGAHGNDKLTGYGKIIGKNALVSRLSEEHGFVTYEKEKFSVGEKISIIPNHACAVVNLFDYAYLVDNGKVTSTIQVDARGKVT